jgi:hypothetical protein
MQNVWLGLVAGEVPIDEQHVRPGGLAMLVVGLLIVATFFLARSFLKHSRRAAEPWPGERDPDTKDQKQEPPS